MKYAILKPDCSGKVYDFDENDNLVSHDDLHKTVRWPFVAGVTRQITGTNNRTFIRHEWGYWYDVEDIMFLTEDEYRNEMLNKLVNKAFIFDMANEMTPAQFLENSVQAFITFCFEFMHPESNQSSLQFFSNFAGAIKHAKVHNIRWYMTEEYDAVTCTKPVFNIEFTCEYAGLLIGKSGQLINFIRNMIQGVYNRYAELTNNEHIEVFCEVKEDKVFKPYAMRAIRF